MKKEVCRHLVCILCVAVTLSACLAAQPDIRGRASEPEHDIEIDLSVSREFAVTRPKQELTTAYASYYITGTSDPDQPVYFEDGEIDRPGTIGLFGVYVELEPGKNTFTFSQGEEDIEVTIIREKESTGAAKLDTITEDSMFPPVQGGAKVGQKLPVRCIAPAGAAVKAEFGGRTVELEQLVPGAQEGIPAVFKGSLPVEGDYDDDVTVNAGPVTYFLEWEDEEAEFTSAGDVYVAGKNSSIAVEVINYIGFVYPDTDDLSDFREYLKEGARDYVKAQNNQYFELASGGYIPIAMTQILEGKINIQDKAAKVSVSSKDRYESYTFHTSRQPAYLCEPDGEGFRFTLFHTEGAPKIKLSSSRLFEGCTVQEEDGALTVSFQLMEDAQIWGYNVSYEDGQTVLRFHYAPELSGTDLPFDGVRILLDPGHGGYDGGANGVPAEFGPDESAINLAHAYVIRDRLRELGATVYLTRSQDDYYSLDDRLRDIEALDADLFLSVHHNSLIESTDAGEVTGMEIYYHTDLSEHLAVSMMEGLAQGTGRKSRFIEQSYYRVTLLPYAPAILMELGYLTHPAEYEDLVDPQKMEEVAEAVAEGLRIALQNN